MAAFDPSRRVFLKGAGLASVGLGSTRSAVLLSPVVLLSAGFRF